MRVPLNDCIYVVQVCANDRCCVTYVVTYVLRKIKLLWGQWPSAGDARRHCIAPIYEYLGSFLSGVGIISIRWPKRLCRPPRWSRSPKRPPPSNACGVIVHGHLRVLQRLVIQPHFTNILQRGNVTPGLSSSFSADKYIIWRPLRWPHALTAENGAAGPLKCDQNPFRKPFGPPISTYVNQTMTLIRSSDSGKVRTDSAVDVPRSMLRADALSFAYWVMAHAEMDKCKSYWKRRLTYCVHGR
jgi:hypothetical protein